MGNAQSAASTRRSTVAPQPASIEIPAVSSPRPHDTIDTSEATQTPTKNEEGGATPQVIQRRRSLMKFPLLRRRPRSVIGLSDKSTDPQVLDSSSPSRRRWRAFSGLKSRPVSTIASPGSLATDLQPREDAPSHSTAASASNDKGKERQKNVAEAVEGDESDVAREPQDYANEPGPSAIDNSEVGPSPHLMLQELQNLQDTLSPGDELRSDVAPEAIVESNSGDSRGQVDRPPTPIPTSVMDSTPGSIEGDVPNSTSHNALAEALGSWMSGRPRTENAEPTSSGSPTALSSHSSATASSSPYANTIYDRFHERDDDSDLLRSFARRSSQAANTLGSPPSMSSVPPAPSTSRIRDGLNTPPLQDRRTLPPAGTGTLVVVQGVVHTTDVRHSHPHAQPNYQPTTTPSTRPSRSASSTPTLRAPTPRPSSRSGSRASTPQPPSTPRRSRFSSLTSGLRQRSRPRTPTSLRSAGIGGWRHGVADAGGGSGNRSETASNRSLGLGHTTDRSASDPETGSTSVSADLSSAGTFVSTDDTSTMQDTPLVRRDEREDARNSIVTEGDPQVPNEGEGTETSVNNGDHVGDRSGDSEGDGISDEESEAELSASSIEVLGTLLSVATAATAASLVTGTTDPLFSSGLAGPLANGRNVPQNSPTANPGSPFLRSDHSSASSTSADNANAEAAVNTRMRAAWESLRDRFSRTRGRRGGAAGDGPGEPREDPREQMLREMARAFNMGLGLDAEDPGEPRTVQRDDMASESIPRDGTSLPEIPRSPPETTPEEFNRTAPEPVGPGLGPGPEGSFERFLHNLQVDLRTALTEDYAARRARAQARVARAANVPAASTSDAASAPNPPGDMENSILSQPTSQAASAEGHEPEVPVLPTSMETEIPDLIPTVPNTPRTANLDLPSLPGDPDFQHGHGSGPPPQAQGITGQPGAGINWWRLYRFPPMQLAPHPSTTNTSTSSAAGVPATAVPSASEHPISGSPSEPSTGNDVPGLSSPTTNAEASQTQNVVPVIVVGLQSVPVNRAGPHRHHHDPPSPLGAHFHSPDPEMPTDVPGRDRAWPLRAASRALGRMGRRTDSDLPPGASTAPPTENAAETATAGMTRTGRQNGRTYLIFVIGGYYPPNHSIVTGADDMNSFEALWELAELLGQVKPPVASKEDIEKSGLEIVKASSLPDYEKSGKVASNTVERCLICLDDYEPQDDLRLLSCRHVFHKLCVDKWLEQGRNNCPACRSKGVRTGDDLTTSTTSTAEAPSEAPSWERE